jgi:ABC-type transport system involved in multi-copper enzyme maturation permease subunit
MKRVLALTVLTFREGIRSRSLFGIAIFSLFILGLNVAVAGFFMRDIGKVTVDMNLSALTFAGLLLVLFIGVNLIAKDIDKKTIHLVLSKPISRVEYLWGKFLGILFFVTASLLVLLLLSCGTIFLLLHLYPEYFLGFSWQVFFLASFFILVKMAVLCSIVVFFSSLTTSSFVTLIFSICSYIVGVTIEEVVFYLRTQFAVEDLALSEPLRKLIETTAYVIPNFAVFDFKLEAAHGLAVDLSRVGIAFGYGAAYITVILLLASFIFQRREFN